MNWLVTGGAGYIGSHIVDSLLAQKWGVTVLDDLSTGVRERVPIDARLVKGNILDVSLVQDLFISGKFDGVMHLAAKKSIAESVLHPDDYMSVNFVGTANILEAAKLTHVPFFLFSSSAAVYGQPISEIIREDIERSPLSPYGTSKLAGEEIVRAAREVGMKTCSLRYFNVVGTKNRLFADQSSSNLLPVVGKQIRSGKRPIIFGNDYPTADGTCVRDYIHVQDLARAHIQCFEALTKTIIPDSLNLATGKGTSVLQIVTEFISQLDLEISPKFLGRRIGDPAMLVADIERANRAIGFNAQYNISDIISSVVEYA